MSKLRPLKLPYGVRDGKLVHVSQVESGKARGCVSPLDEGTALVARKGSKNREHFATQSSFTPQAAYETVFHRLAKEVLSDARSRLLPGIKLSLESRYLVLQRANVVDGTKVISERRIKDSVFTADSILVRDVHGTSRELIVEWVVTHPCEPAKIEFLRVNRVPSVEIELGQAAGSLTPAQMRQWLLFDAPRKWVWHPLFEWDELRRRGFTLVRKPAFHAVRFFKTRAGTKAVEESWVKDCARHGKIVSLSCCRRCPYAYAVEYLQDGYVDCLFGGKEPLLDGSRSEPKRALSCLSMPTP